MPSVLYSASTVTHGIPATRVLAVTQLLRKMEEIIDSLFDEVSAALDITNFAGRLEGLSNCVEFHNTLIETQKPFSCLSAAEERDNKLNLKEFEEWLLRNNAEFKKVQPFYSKKLKCNGIQCLENLSSGSEAFRLSESCMITGLDFFGSSPWLELSKRPEYKFLQDMQLCLVLHLLTEKLRGKASNFYEYIKILPESFESLPLYWTPDEIKLLEGTSGDVWGVSRKLNTYRLYCGVYMLLTRLKTQKHKREQPVLARKLEYFTLENFMWAMAVVMTRQNDAVASPSKLKLYKRSQDLVLIPLFDLCNHEPGELSSEYQLDNEKVWISTKAHRNFSKGEEYKIFYGNRSTAGLLVYSGFVVKINRVP